MMLSWKIQPSDYEDIAWRIVCGETLQQVANDYGVTRERIRQIVWAFDVHPKEIRYARMQMKVRKHAEEIIYHLESWHPVYWQNYGFLRPEFEKHLKLDEYPEYSDLWFRYVTAQSNPYSKIACPDGRICVRCRVWFEWDDFYADRNGINEKSQQCIACARKNVTEYHQARYIPKPTVTERQCPHCKVLKPASEYWRNTHNNSGLQTYCKECQRAWHNAEDKK